MRQMTISWVGIGWRGLAWVDDACLHLRFAPYTVLRDCIERRGGGFMLYVAWLKLALQIADGVKIEERVQFYSVRPPL